MPPQAWLKQNSTAVEALYVLVLRGISPQPSPQRVPRLQYLRASRASRPLASEWRARIEGQRRRTSPPFRDRDSSSLPLVPAALHAPSALVTMQLPLRWRGWLCALTSMQPAAPPPPPSAHRPTTPVGAARDTLSFRILERVPCRSRVAVYARAQWSGGMKGTRRTRRRAAPIRQG